MNTFKEKFRDYLKRRGLNFTTARIKVLNATLAIKGHFNAEDVFLYLRKNIKKIVSRATTYRTINLLVDGEFISEIVIYNGVAIYEWTYEKKSHAHLLCVRCGGITEVCKQKVENIRKEVSNKHGFYPVNHGIIIKGYCSKCQKTKGTINKT